VDENAEISYVCVFYVLHQSGIDAAEFGGRESVDVFSL
jgi:hypothetical protein